MESGLVNQAVKLFNETLPLADIDINTESFKWHDLYSKECELYTLLGKMNVDEVKEYKVLIIGPYMSK